MGKPRRHPALRNVHHLHVVTPADEPSEQLPDPARDDYQAQVRALRGNGDVWTCPDCGAQYAVTDVDGEHIAEWEIEFLHRDVCDDGGGA